MTIKKRHFPGLAWYWDISERLRTKDGWQVFAKMTIFVFTLLGGIVALATFYSGSLESTLERGEKSYYSFLENFSSSKKENRMGATFEIPSLLTKKVPKDSHVSLFNAVSYLFGASKETVPLYHEKIKKLLFDRIRSFDAENTDWSQKEMEELISILLKIDSSGWYTAYINPNEDSPNHRRNKFNWIWRGGSSGAVSSYILPSIFEGTKLNGIDFSNNDFKYPDFIQASLKGCQFKYSTISGGQFNFCIADSLNISWARILRTDFSSANLSNSSFYNCFISDCNFGTSTDGDSRLPVKLNNTSFQGDSISNVNFEKAIMDSSSFVNASVIHANFYSCDLNFSDMSNLRILENSNFEFSNSAGIRFNNDRLIRNSFKSANLNGANFSNAEIRECIFDRADLTGSDLTGCNIYDTATSWKSANIALAKGLDNKQKAYLFSKGAVSIPGKRTWQKYMKEGARSNWKDYNNPSR